MNIETARDYWLGVMERIARPVLEAAAQSNLKKSMPVEKTQEPYYFNKLHPFRDQVSATEAFCRTLAGIAPWLELEGLQGHESDLQKEFRTLAVVGLERASDPHSPDYLCFDVEDKQIVVEGAYLANALLRAPRELVGKLAYASKKRLISDLKKSRRYRPWPNNWLLFSAMIETWLACAGEDFDRMRIDYALRQHDQWYKGDGVYGDGPHFHWDYYNSYVIHPMLTDILLNLRPHSDEWDYLFDEEIRRHQRFAEVLERMISPEGAYPPLGRSIVYRFGAFQTLSHLALLGMLPARLEPAQVRCALTSVIRRQIEAPGTFDAQGWLRLGFCGWQPQIPEGYSTTGSLYLCLTGMLALGLHPTSAFWCNPDKPWTQALIYSGQNVSRDEALA